MPTCTLEPETVERIRQHAGIPPPTADGPANPGDDGWTTVRAILSEAVTEQVEQRRDPAYQLWRLFSGAAAVERIPELTEAMAVACSAFMSGRVLILIDRRQARTLDEWVRVLPGSQIVFLKLPTLTGA
jgi:hypothetical protein